MAPFGLGQTKPVQSKTASPGPGPVRPSGENGPDQALPQTGSIRTGEIIGKRTGSLTICNATGSSIMLYNGWVTVRYGPAGNLRSMSKMHRNYLISCTKRIQGSLKNDWTGGLCLCVDMGFTLLTFLWITCWCICHQHWFLPPTTGGGVSPCTEPTMRWLLCHESVVDHTKVVLWCTHLGFVYLCDVFCAYRCVADEGVCS